MNGHEVVSLSVGKGVGLVTIQLKSLLHIFQSRPVGQIGDFGSPILAPGPYV